MNCSRGSEWRRWDLHVHTPDTLKNDVFTVAAGEDKWQKFFDSILEYVGDMSDPQKAVYAIGITDYFSIENYRKVISNEEITKKIPLILPNIELRLMPAGSQLLNLHCIFNPALSPDEIESRFLSNLKFQKDNQQYDATPRGLVRLGRAIEKKNDIDDFWAKKVAVDQFNISIDQVKDIFNADKNLRENTLIVLPNSQNSGGSAIGNQNLNNASSALTTTRSELYKFADAIFSANPNDVLHFAGGGTTPVEKVVEDCGKLMPCIHGSDAHKFSELFEPVGKRYCWIKADCTFNGLMQIKYEPKNRVKISEFKPDIKRPYYVIDQVIINDADFINTPILFNENLTCIIGGKSTGKSVLLNNIASTIDNKQVDDKYALIAGGRSRSETYPKPKLTVKWCDGATSQRTDVSSDRKIIYIPQTYLNRLADESTEKNDIDDIIEGVLLQNTKIKAAFDQMNKKIAENKSYVDKKIYDVIKNKNRVKEIKDNILELGVLKSIKEGIEELKTKKQELSKQASISEDAQRKFDEATTNNRTIDSKLRALLDYKIFLTETDSLLIKKEIYETLDHEYLNQIEAEIKKEYDTAQQSWNEYKVKQTEFISKKEIEFKKEKEKNNTIIETVQKKMVDSEALSRLSKDIETEERKKSEVEAYYKQLEVLEKQCKTDIEDLIVKSRYYENIYNSFATEVNKEAEIDTSIDGGLTFNVKSVFRGDFFVSEFLKTFNTNRKKFKDIFDRFEENFCQQYDYDDECKQKVIETAFINGSESVLKKATTIESALRIIFTDFYTVNYTVLVDNDEIKQMSPGKKALVLLKLLINLADSSCPILIDQPEDDLDNRSIYKDLVEFIRDKKVKRQIILVTHNANIVLGCDAEEIIVANQKGSNTPNKQFRFEYRSGSIENITPRKDQKGKELGGILNSKGIQHHICELLEGGRDAFNTRKKKYTIVK